MPVSTQITSQKFYSQYRNDEDWLTLPDDFTSFLIGNVGEKLRVVMQMNLRWNTGLDGSPQDGFAASGNTITRQAGSFFDDGFALGDTVSAYTSGGTIASPNIVADAVITYIDATTVIVDLAVSNPSPSYAFFIMEGKSNLEGCFFKYGLIENQESTNYDSKIDFNEQAYSVNGLVAAGVGVPLQMNEQDSANVKSWINGRVDVSFEGTLNTGTIKQYEIIHEFIILPYFIEGWLANLQNGTVPTLLNNNKALKYVFEADFRQSVNNPNESKIVDQDSVLGNTGFDGQNFNGFVNEFSVSNLVKTEVSSGNSTDAIIVTSKTRFTFDATKASGNFAGNEPVIVMISYLPEQADYLDPTKTVEENFLYDTLRAVTGGGAVSGSIIKDLDVTHVPATPTLNITVDFEYTAAQQAVLDNSKHYGVWVLVGSDVASFTVNKSNLLDDRSRLAVDVDQYVKNPDIPNLIRGNVQSLFFRHYREFGVDAGKTDVKGWVEDGYLWWVKFDKLTSQQSTIIGAKFHYAAFKDQNNWFPIRTHTFDIGPNSTIVPNQFSPQLDNQIIQVDGRRGFNLEQDDQFNLATFNTRPILDNSVEINEILTGFKLSWEEWEALQGADPVFFDPTNQYGNNGFNRESTHYQANGYTLRTLIVLEIEKDGVVTDYVISSPDFDVHTYDEDGNAKPRWACSLNTRSADSSINFNGAVKTDEDSRIVGTFTPQTYVSGLTYFAVIRIDDQLGNENSIRELSSMATVTGAFNAPSPISELKPLAGETGSLITDTGAVVRVECLIDHTKLQKGLCYKISCHLWQEGIGEFPEDPLVKSQDGLPLILSQASYETLEVTT